MPTTAFHRSRALEAGTLAIAFTALTAGVAARTSLPHAGLVLRILAIALLLFWSGYLRPKLTPWIVTAMMAGIVTGLDAPGFALNVHFLSDIFLRLIKTIVAPLILTTLISGIAGHGDLKGVGRLAWRSILYFEIITTFALVIGLVAIDISKAGVGVQLPPATSGSPIAGIAAPVHFQDFVTHIFPENIAKSIAEGQVLQVAVFGLIFGIALALTTQKTRNILVPVAEAIAETMFRFTNLVMYFAPLGVFGAMAYTIAHTGPEVLIHLGKLLITLYVALAVFALVVLLPVAMIARIPLRRFLRHVYGPASIAFATASSEAALPRAMEEMEAFGVPRKIVAFVIPTGYSFNLEGSTLYLALALGFVAQAGGVHLSITEQIVIMLTLMISSKGVAGVPRAVLVVLAGTITAFNLPSTPIPILLGIDALMDMGRTMLSVVGNSLATAVMAQWEGELNTGTPSLAVREGHAE